MDDELLMDDDLILNPLGKEELFDINSINGSSINNEINTEKQIQFRLQKLGRKKITMVIGIEELVCDLSKLKSKISTKLGCSCSLKTFKEGKYVGKQFLKLSGDQRYEIRDYLIEKGYVDKGDRLTIHG